MSEKIPGEPTWDKADAPLPEEAPELPAEVLVSFKHLSAADIEAVKKEFLAQQREEKAKAERKRLMEALLTAARESEDAKEEQVELLIEVPDFAAVVGNVRGLCVDGRLYLHGRRERMPRRRAESLREAMQSAWRHEDITFGRRNPNAYQRRNGYALGPSGPIGALAEDNTIVRF